LPFRIWCEGCVGTYLELDSNIVPMVGWRNYCNLDLTEGCGAGKITGN